MTNSKIPSFDDQKTKNGKKMFRMERLQKILDLVNKERKIYVEDLTKVFNVGASSIRLDLAELDRMGLIIRTYGGAVITEDAIENSIKPKAETAPRPVLEMRGRENLSEKEMIGKVAAGYIDDGDTIMIDGGSTTQFLVKNLVNKKGLTVVTNSLPHIPELIKIENVEIYFVGGLIYLENLVSAGNFAIESLKQIHVMKAFLGIDGISIEKGLTVGNPSATALFAIKKHMIEASDVHYILADYSKLGKTCLIPVVPLTEMDYLITDSGAQKEMIEQIKSLGINVVIAKPE